LLVEKDAIILYEDMISLPNYASICQAGMKALELASDWLLANINENESLAIFSDAQSALKAISGTKINQQSTIDCNHKLGQLQDSMDVEIHWIKGHANSTGNEHADYLAKKSLKEGHPINIGMGKTYSKQLIQEYIR